MKELYFDKHNVSALCSAIVTNAIKDWRRMCRKEIKEMKQFGFCDPKEVIYCKETYKTIRNFFNSDYGESVCLACNIHPDRIVSYLEKYRNDCLEKARKDGAARGKKRS